MASGSVPFAYTGLFFNLCFGSILFDALNAIQTACLGLIALGSGNNFAVGSLQAETEFTGFIGVNLVLRILHRSIAFHSLIFYCGGAVFADAFNAILAGSSGGINLGNSNDFAIAGNEIELNAGFNFFDDKFSHDDYLILSK